MRQCLRSGRWETITSIALTPPSSVDPQWNILYWGSKWNLCTFCWDAIGYVWGTTSVYFGITCVSFIFSRLPVITVEPQYQHRDFLVKVSFEGHTHRIFKKNSCWFKFWMGFVGQLLIKLRTSSIGGFLSLPGWCPLVLTCWWPLSHNWSMRPTSPHLSGFVWYGGLKAYWI